MSYEKKKKELARKVGDFDKEIQDEKEGEKHYKSLSKKHPKASRAFKEMSEDESKHKHYLQTMNK